MNSSGGPGHQADGSQGRPIFKKAEEDHGISRGSLQAKTGDTGAHGTCNMKGGESSDQPFGLTLNLSNGSQTFIPSIIQ